MERLQTQHQMSALAGRSREASQQQARPARLHFVAVVRGAGETRLTGKKAINFGAFLMDEPAFSSGVIVHTPLKLGELPQCTAMVTRWVKDARGMYIGAEMAFFVDCPRGDVHLTFSLSFEASTLRSTAGHDARK